MTKMMAKQYFMLGEDPPGVRLELVHGEIGVSPSPSFSHSYTDGQLRYILMSHLETHDLGVLLGDLDTLFGEYNVRRPDILFVAKSRLHLIKGHGIPIAPDLCVEIISPSSVAVDEVDKAELYAEYGVPNYWIVDPIKRTFKSYQLQNKAYVLNVGAKDSETIQAAPFEDLSIPLGRLWSPLSAAD